MLFNSYIFIFAFLPITFLGYFVLNHYRLILASKFWLLGASFFFYGWWNYIYITLLLGSIVINYNISKKMMDSELEGERLFSRKQLLVMGLTINVLFLGYFKYADFFLDNINYVFSSSFGLLHLALPLAISFFTLQQIAFLVDVYDGLSKKQTFVDYALFVSFFPQLIAGPIVHHEEMMPQFEALRNKFINYYHIAQGLLIFSIGLFKKVVIADSFAVWATSGFDQLATLTFFDAWITSLSYTFQIYFDFSGYTDMAIGLGLLFNIKIPVNFNSPYKAANIIDFWKRWHISLTNFIRSYVYSPITRSLGKITFEKKMMAIVITMFISGLWHGASWTFVLWGLLHGTAIVINHLWRRLELKMPYMIGWFLTFNFVNIAFIIFRAKEWEDVIKVLKGMLGWSGVVFPQRFYTPSLEFLTEHGVTFLDSSGFSLRTIIPVMAISFLLVIFSKNSIHFKDFFRPNLYFIILTITCLTCSISNINKVSEFLYFQF